MNNIQLKNINKSFNKHIVLENFNYVFYQDNIYAIVGDNGSGKTTLISIISNLLIPDSGEVIFSTKKETPFMLLSGDRNLHFKVTVKNNIDYFSILYNIHKEDKCKIYENLNFFFENVSEIIDKKVELLSFGQKRKVALSIAFGCGKSIIILDEVIEGLDQDSQNQVIKMIKDHKKEKIILCISHDLDFVHECSDKILFLKAGKLITDIDSDQIEILKKEYKTIVSDKM